MPPETGAETGDVGRIDSGAERRREQPRQRIVELVGPLRVLLRALEPHRTEEAHTLGKSRRVGWKGFARRRLFHVEDGCSSERVTTDCNRPAGAPAEAFRHTRR